MTLGDSRSSLHSIIYLVIAGTVTLLSRFGFDLSQTAQLTIPVIMVAIVGAPHGALASWLARATGIAFDCVGMVRFLAIYMFQIAAAIDA